MCTHDADTARFEDTSKHVRVFVRARFEDTSEHVRVFVRARFEVTSEHVRVFVRARVHLSSLRLPQAQIKASAEGLGFSIWG